MSIKTKKILTLMLLAVITVSFTGCLNLSKKDDGENEVKKISINEHQGVFKSIDGGKTWEHKIAVECNNTIDNVKISSMAIDPNDNDTLYLGTVSNGLYKSENGANRWRKITDRNNVLSATAKINSIAVEKGNSDVVYVAALNDGRGMLLKSEDGGESWIKSHIVSEQGRPVNIVKIDPIFRNIVYIGTEEIQGGFLRSENRGKDWVTLHWFNTGVKNILIDFKNNDGIVLRTASNIFKSVNKGVNWESLSNRIVTSSRVPVDFSTVSAMTMDNHNPLIIYINFLNLILKTEDGGETWKRLNTITPSRTAVGTIPQIKQIGIIDNMIYYGAGNVLYKSNNRGVSWSSYNIITDRRVIIKGDVRYTVSDYMDQEVIYVGSFYTPPPPPPEDEKKKNPFLPY